MSKNIEDAISLTVDEISNAGYLDSDTGGIVITTSSDDMNEAKELAQTLEKVVNKSVEKNNHQAVITSEAVETERVAEARKLGVTPGKLNLVEKMIESSDNSEDLNKEEWLHKSVKDIMAKTNEYKEQNREQEQNQNQEQNSGDDETGETNETSGNSENQNPDSGSSNSEEGNNSGFVGSSNKSGN